MEFTLTEDQLTELVEYHSRMLVGKVMRKFEIVNDQAALKGLLKDTIYEEGRHLRDLLVSVGAGAEFKQIKFSKKK